MKIEDISPPVTAFLLKLYDMVDSKEVDLINWNTSSCNSFIIDDPNEFAAKILPRYFRHGNYSSFVHQLNDYGFYIISQKLKTKRQEYKNEWFRRGQKDLLQNIKRRSADSSRKRVKLSNELKGLQASTDGAKVDSLKTRARETVEKTDVAKDLTLGPVFMGFLCNGMTISQGKLLQKLPDENTQNVAESDTKQQDVPLAPLTVVDKDGSEKANVASVAPKRKMGGPPKLQAKIPETHVAVEVNHKNEGLGPAAISLIEGSQTGEICSPIVTEQPELGKQDKLPIENTGQVLYFQRETKKYSSKKENPTEAPTQESQDASKDGILEKDSTTKCLEPSAGKSLTTMFSDQPLSYGIHTPMTFNDPDGTVEQSSSQLQVIACYMDGENLPFVRRNSLWKIVESMEVFQKIPQRPHFRPLLEDAKENDREIFAIGQMLVFGTVAEKTSGLRFDDPKSTIEDCLKTLVKLEPYGFEVDVIKERLTRLVSLRDKQEVLEVEEEVEEVDRQLRKLEEKKRQLMKRKIDGDSY